MDLADITSKVAELARTAGDFIRTESLQFDRLKVSDKGLNQLVSYVDVTAEQMLVKGLGEIVPDAGFITEEGTTEKKNDTLFWVIDPLDGTTNFIHGVPVYSVSLALVKDGEVQLGVVYEISRDECFYAWKGGGAYLNGERIYVSKAETLAQSLLATGFPYYDFKRIQDYLKLLHDLMKATHGLRRLGSAAVDLAYVSCGRFEGFFEYGLSPWDVAAGVLLVTEAGGRVSDFHEGNNYIFGHQIVASCPQIFPEFSAHVKKYLG